MDLKTMIRLDRKYVWHPFTQMRDWQTDEVVVIEEGQGCYLIDSKGKRYLDGVSSLWCNVHGHRVKELDRAVRKQLGKIAHSTFLGLTHPTAVELAEKLIVIAPRGLQRVFYSDSGSEAVEIAIKMAYQYWQQRGKTKKKKFVKLTNAYHGDTLGSVSVGGIDLFHRLYKPLLFESFSVPSPYRYRWPTGSDPEHVKEASLKAMEDVFKKHHDEIAALVMEPLMQGAAGMIDQPQGYISRARQLTKKYNALLIFDEVATGFGRTGTMFAAAKEQVTPDLMAVAKGLTGGYLPLAATLTTEEVYGAFLGRYDELKTFFHGHTYTANPLACAVSIANLELFEKQGTLKKLRPKIEFLHRRLRDFYRLEHVGDVRHVGTMVGIELVRDKKTKTPYDLKEKIGVRVIERARAKGAILRPLGGVIVLMPPLAIRRKELQELLDITYDSIKEATHDLC